ncbi:MAG: hypothetical protein MI974_11000 [Chitinophagales bacterium]|nr:hypothetical protein [Chitinophagales bacterium]
MSNSASVTLLGTGAINVTPLVDNDNTTSPAVKKITPTKSGTIHISVSGQLDFASSITQQDIYPCSEVIVFNTALVLDPNCGAWWYRTIGKDDGGESTIVVVKDAPLYFFVVDQYGTDDNRGHVTVHLEGYNPINVYGKNALNLTKGRSSNWAPIKGVKKIAISEDMIWDGTTGSGVRDSSVYFAWDAKRYPCNEAIVFNTSRLQDPKNGELRWFSHIGSGLLSIHAKEGADFYFFLVDQMGVNDNGGHMTCVVQNPV